MTDMMTKLEIPANAALPLRVSELLSSRLCHDLISPVAAISNGFELLGDDGVGAEPEIGSLISLSIRNAAGRLTLFRAAYGLGGENADAISFDEAAGLIAGIIENNKVSLNIPTGTDAPGRVAIKLFLNLAILALEALPGAGTLKIAYQPDEDTVFAVNAEGDGAALRPEVIEALVEGTDIDALTPRSVQGYFASWLARSAGLGFDCIADQAGKVSLLVRHPR